MSLRELAREIYRVERLATSHATSPQLGYSSTDTGVDIVDADGNVVGTVGRQDDGGVAVKPLEGPTPPPPSTPIVDWEWGIIHVKWDGGFTTEGVEADGGVFATSDLACIDVHASTSPTFEDTTEDGTGVLIATIYAPPEGGASTAVAGMQQSGEWYVRLVARSTAGKVSEPSETATVTVGLTSVSEGLWESWIKAEEALETADGKNTVHGYGGEQPPVESAKDGDLWFDDEHVPHKFDEFTGEWVTVTDARITALQDAEASLRGELEVVKNSAKGDGSLVHYSPKRPDESKAKAGDVWFDTSLNENGEPVNRVHVFDASKGRFVYVADERLARVEQAQEGLKSDLSAVKATADGKNQSYYQPTEPAGTLVKGDLWFDTSTSGKNRVSVWDGKAWADASDKRVADVASAQEALSSDLAGVRASVDGKTSTRWEVSVPTSATPGRVTGDTWHQYKGGKHVGTWRWDGKKWVQQSFDPVMIPMVDIGTGTFGELDGARLKANSVQADSVLVKGTVGSTLIADGAITTDKIATGAITADSSVIGSLDAGKITVGELDGARIKAGTVAADKVLIGSGGNLIPNGDGLTTSNNGFTGVDHDVKEKALVMPSNGAWYSSATFRVEPGEYELSADIKGPNGSHVYVGITDDVNRRAYGISNVTITGAWKTYTSTLVVDQPRSEQPQVVRILPGYNDKLPDSEKTWIRNISLRKKVGATVIADGAITTEKIATGAITAESGVIGSLDLGKATVGELDGARIKAGTVTVDQLLSGSPSNVLPGVDNLSVSAPGWSSFGLNKSDPSLWLKGRTTVMSDVVFELSAGATYTASTDVKSTVDDTQWLWQLMGQGGQPSPYIFSYETAGTRWRTVTNQFTVKQSGRYKLRVWANHTKGASNKDGYQWWRNMRISPAVDATLIKDGSVTTSKIAAGAITANSGVIGSLDASKITVGQMDGKHIKANTIATEQLAAGAVKAGILDANAVNGMTITGATLRTSASNPRVELNSKGLFSYAKDGKQTFSALSGTGDVSLVGSLSSDVPGARRVVIDNSLWANKPYVGVNGESLFADATGIRIGKDGDPMTYGDISYAEVYDVPMPGGFDESGGIPSGRRTYVPHLTIEGPGSNVQSRAQFSLAAGGQVTLTHSRGFMVRDAGLSGELFSMYNGGEVVLQSRTNANLHLGKAGLVTLRSGASGTLELDAAGSADLRTPSGSRLHLSNTGYVGLYAGKLASIDMGGDILIMSNGNEPITLRTGNNKVLFEVGARGGNEVEWGADRTRITRGSLFYQSAPETGRMANVFMGEDGWMAKSSSSRRYKHDIQGFHVPDELLDVPFRTWIDKGEYERNDNSSEGLTRIPGLVAEEVSKACPELVVYDKQGRPDALYSDRIGMAALTLIRRQRDRINVLEERLTALEKLKG